MRTAKFVGCDDFSRPTFKVKETGLYYCFVNFLCDGPITQEQIDEAFAKERIHYKGDSPDDEPYHAVFNVTPTL